MSQEIITTPPDTPHHRELAGLISQQGADLLYAESIAAKIPYKEYMAKMLWEFITEGVMHFADGGTLICDDYNQWLSTVKFVTSHLDGPARSDIQVGVNVFKVYMNIDEERV